MVPTWSYITPRHDHDSKEALTTFTSSDGFPLPVEPEVLYALGDNGFSVTNHQQACFSPQSSTAHSPASSATPFEPDPFILSNEQQYDTLLEEVAMEANLARSYTPETLRSGSDLSRTRSISSTNSSHSPLLPQSPSTYRSSFNDHAQPHITPDSPTLPTFTSAATPLLHRSANNMSTREKKRLLRSHRKLSKILGETPVLLTTFGSSDVSLSMITEQGGGNSGGLSTGRRRTTVPIMRHDNGTSQSSLQVHHAPRLRRASSPVPSRSPPVLRIDTAASPKSKRPRQNTSETEGDALSFISTTTTTTMLDAQHRHHSRSHPRRSPLSPVSSQSFLSSEGEAERAKEKKRIKMAKLSRHLGETVPSELVFPVDLPKASSVCVISPDSTAKVKKEFESRPVSGIETWSADVAKNLSAEKRSNVYAPPRRSSLIKRKKRISLSLDFARRRNTQNTGALIVRAHSLNRRADRPEPGTKLSVDQDSPENDENKLQGKAGDDHEDFRQAQAPISEKQRVINVRRAQKMSRLFGAPPPRALLHVTNARALSALDEDDVESVRRLKRHSFHSVMSVLSTQTDRTAVAREDSPTPTPQIVEATQDHGRGKSSMPSRRTHKRGQSLNDVPPTPPPFFHYFQAPSMSPRVSSSTASSGSTPHTPSPTVSGLPIGNPMPLAKRPARSHRHAPSSPSAFSTTSSVSLSPTSPHSPRSPNSFSDMGSPTSVAEKLKALDPLRSPRATGGATFAARRQRATKLTKFFGVAYGELFPATSSDVSLKTETDVTYPSSPTRRTSSQIDIALEGKGTAGKSSSRTRMPLSLRPILGDRDQHQNRSCMRIDPDTAMRSPLEGVSVVVQRNVWHDDELVSNADSVREMHLHILRRVGSCEEIDARKRSSEEEASVSLGRSKRDASMLEVMEKLRELR